MGAFLSAVIAFIEYLGIASFLANHFSIDLDIFPERHPDNPKKTWLGAGIYIICFVITLLLYYWIIGDPFLDPDLII